MKCTDCRYVHKGPIVLGNNEAQCRRYPPSITFLASPKGIVQMSAYPVVKLNDGCGDWEAKSIEGIVASHGPNMPMQLNPRAKPLGTDDEDAV